MFLLVFAVAKLGGLSVSDVAGSELGLQRSSRSQDGDVNTQAQNVHSFTHRLLMPDPFGSSLTSSDSGCNGILHDTGM